MQSMWSAARNSLDLAQSYLDRKRIRKQVLNFIYRYLNKIELIKNGKRLNRQGKYSPKELSKSLKYLFQAIFLPIWPLLHSLLKDPLPGNFRCIINILLWTRAIILLDVGPCCWWQSAPGSLSLTNCCWLQNKFWKKWIGA